MSDERIDIEVTDKVSTVPATKIRDIAKAAREGASAVSKLKQALAEINDTAVKRLQAASVSATKAIKDQLTAQNSLTAAMNAGVAADLKAETAKQRLTAETAKAALAEAKLATEAAKTQAAVARATQAQTAAAAAALRLATANANVASSFAAEQREAEALNAAAARLRASVDPLQSSLDRLNNELAEARSLASQGVISARELALAESVLKERIEDVTQAQNTQNAALKAGATHSKALTQAGLNLGRQFADVGVTFAMGMNPFMILVQQGPQIIDIFSQLKSQGIGTGQAFGLLAKEMGILLPILLIVAAVAAAVGAAFALMARDINKSVSKSELIEGLNLSKKQMEIFKKSIDDTSMSTEDLATKLGLTTAQMKQLKNVSVTTGDTAKAVFQVLGKYISDALDMSGVQKNIDTFLDNLSRNSVIAGAILYGVFVGSYRGVIKVWSQLPAAMGDLFYSAVNLGITALEKLVNASIAGINEVVKFVNNIPGVKLPTIDPVSLKRVSNRFAGAGKQVAEGFTTEVAKATLEGYKGLQQFGKDVKKQAINNAKNRIQQQGLKLPKGSEAKPKKGFDSVKELQNVNRELDNELARTGLLAEQAQVQQRLDQITQKFAEHGIILDAATVKGLKEKIEAIQTATRVQTQMNTIYDNAAKPQQTYNDTLAAAKKLLDAGKISQAAYTYEVEQASSAFEASKDLIGANAALRTYNDTVAKATYSLSQGAITQTQFNEATAAAKYSYDHAHDALLSYNDELNNQLALLGKFGPNLEKVTYLQGVQNALLAQGKTLYDASTGALTAEGAALAAKFDQLQRGKQVQEELNAIYEDVTANQTFLSNMAAMYAGIDDMRKNDVLTAEQAERAKMQLQNKYEGLRLKNTQSFFGNLATLSSSGNAELAAIGKAAAVAQATIDGYLAVQKALASAPPPFNFALAAAAAAAAGVQVAGILSTNVGSFNTGADFMVNGNPGVDQNLISMNVSKGERVIVQTPAQQNAAASGNGQGASQAPSYKIVNISDPTEIPAAMDSSEGETVILNTIRRNASAVKAALS